MSTKDFLLPAHSDNTNISQVHSDNTHKLERFLSEAAGSKCTPGHLQMTTLPIDDVYFGTKRTNFRRAAGSTVCFIESEWSADDSPDGVQNSLSYQRKIIMDGFDVPLAVPGIPALDFVRNSFDYTMSSMGVPPVLHYPLLKCPEQETDVVGVIGIASGVRSAVIKVDSKWYRLKGCGNNEDGFLMKESRSSTETWQQMRGSAFPPTAYRELMYTSRLSRVLEPKGILCANSAVGYALYDHPLAPSLQPTCIIAETRGDRRLGSHVLAGLTLLLPQLIDTSSIDTSKLSDIFPAQRPGRHFSDIKDFVRTEELITDMVLGTFSAGHDRDTKGLCWPDLERDGSVLANMIQAQYGLPLVCPHSPPPPLAEKQYPMQWTREGAVDMSPRWRLSWDKACAELTELLHRIGAGANTSTSRSLLMKDGGGGASPSLLLGYLFSRCGYDAGRILRGLHSEKVSWGTYQDELCNKEWDEWHCNAHANNLVVVPEGSVPPDHPGAHSLLSFLDLDMAFSAADFIDVENKRVGVSEEVFASIMWKEHVSLMEVLAGSDSSTGVPMVAASAAGMHEDAITVIKSGLYDTLIMGYLSGYHDDAVRFPVMPYDETLQAAAHSIIRLAIIIMADYVA